MTGPSNPAGTGYASPSTLRRGLPIESISISGDVLGSGMLPCDEKCEAPEGSGLSVGQLALHVGMELPGKSERHLSVCGIDRLDGIKQMAGLRLDGIGQFCAHGVFVNGGRLVAKIIAQGTRRPRA